MPEPHIYQPRYLSQQEIELLTRIYTNHSSEPTIGRLNAALEWADAMRSGELALGFVLSGRFALEVAERDGEEVVALKDLGTTPATDFYAMLDKAVGR